MTMMTIASRLLTSPSMSTAGRLRQPTPHSLCSTLLYTHPSESRQSPPALTLYPLLKVTPCWTLVANPCTPASHQVCRFSPNPNRISLIFLFLGAEARDPYSQSQPASFDVSKSTLLAPAPLRLGNIPSYHATSESFL